MTAYSSGHTSHILGRQPQTPSAPHNKWQRQRQCLILLLPTHYSLLNPHTSHLTTHYYTDQEYIILRSLPSTPPDPTCTFLPRLKRQETSHIVIFYPNTRNPHPTLGADCQSHTHLLDALYIPRFIFSTHFLLRDFATLMPRTL